MTLLVKPGRYGLIFAAATVLGGLAVTLLERATTWDVPTAFMTILPPMIAAMLEGSRIGRETGAALPRGSWPREALVLTAVAAVIKLVLVGLVITWMMRIGMIETLAPGPMALVALVDLVATFAVNALFLVLGVRNELRTRSR